MERYELECRNTFDVEMRESKVTNINLRFFTLGPGYLIVASKYIAVQGNADVAYQLDA